QRVVSNYAGRDYVRIDDSGILRMREDRARIEARIRAPRIGTLEDGRPSDSSGSFEGLSRPEDDPEAGIGPAFRRSSTFDSTNGATTGDSQNQDDPWKTQDSNGGEGPDSEDGEENLRSPEALFDIYRHRTEVDDLGNPGISERAGELVDEAEAYMVENKYAKAMDRLKDALRLNPGDPLIEAGLANSQIGFGAYFSAQITLSKLFTGNPELVGAAFSDPKVIPNRTNLMIAADDIRSRIAAGMKSSSTRNAGLGMVLAYIGWQLDDQSMISEGLDKISESPEAGLEGLLRAIWLAPVDSAP
ncbi:MAG: hypothetical protein O3A19_03455, partial [Planctomycetota bacterium]|nr:hypothetical protein [Planctomycetota bacterium]